MWGLGANNKVYIDIHVYVKFIEHNLKVKANINLSSLNIINKIIYSEKKKYLVI